MTQVYIIIGIITLICGLIGYIFIKQTIVKRKQERMRLQRALEKRANGLIHMLNAFPPGFLSQELLIFLYRCIVDVFEQLSKLEPENQEYLQQFQAYTIHMETSISTPQSKSEASLQSSAQINEIRHNLNHLGRFIQRSMQRGNISAKQYSNYKQLLKNLTTSIMVDNYLLSAKEAVQIEKNKLAVHYYTLAKNMIIKEGLKTDGKERLLAINEELSTLEKLVAEEEKQQKIDSAENETDEAVEAKPWQKYNDDEDWKKKNVYD